MGKLPVPAMPTLHTRQYQNLKGVDYSCDLTEVSRFRTPTGLNMISDEGGNPIKRIGWRKLIKVSDGKVLDIIFLKEKVEGLKELVTYVISTDGVFSIAKKTTGETEKKRLISWNIESATCYVFNDILYIIANGGMYKVKGFSLKEITKMGSMTESVDGAYIPEVTISQNPDGTGGTSLEPVNLISPYRSISFLGDETSTKYCLYPERVWNDTTSPFRYVLDIIKVEARDENGQWQDVQFTKPSQETVNYLDKAGNFITGIAYKPYVMLSKPYKAVVTGQDNIKITFKALNTEKVKASNGQYAFKGQSNEGLRDLLKGHCALTYGMGSIDRVFVVGGENRNKIYYSDVNNPLYFPDVNNIVVGHGLGGVVGLHRKSGFLVAVRDNTGTEGTLSLISGAEYNGETYFKISETTAKVGAMGTKTFATLIDEPLFLSKDGIYAISNYYTSTETIVRNRSGLLDKKMLAEPNLDNACAISWNRYYFLAVNGNCYVMDGRQRTRDNKGNSDLFYESYFWNNIPAVTFASYDDDLMFGTEDGYICKFNFDIKNRTAYCDDGDVVSNSEGGMALENGVAIPCEWSTPLDDDGIPQYFKNLNKKGTLLTMLPYDRTSAYVELVADGGEVIPVGTFYADIFNWELIDFTRFTFNSDDTAQDAFFRKKVKKYKRLRIVVKNNEIYEPFGILGITKTYAIKNFSKNRR